MRHLATITVALFTSLVCQSAWAQDCTSDADCGEGYYCSTDDVSLPVSCVDSENCPEPEVGPGVCELAPLTCTSDADCPSPLFCVEHQTEEPCTVALGDTTPCEPVVETTKLCTYVIADCSSNADCAAGYECAAMPGSTTCTSEGAACPVGEECPPPTEVCETDPDWNMCFPARAPCATDADCADDWVCYDFGEEGTLPPWWESDGNFLACMPPGIVAVIEGQAEFEDQGVQSSAEADRVGSGSSADTPDVGTSKGSGDSGGCSVKPGSLNGMDAGALLMLGLGLGFARRHRPPKPRC